jgi:glycosyltransferase involved in cell wall biosynthesis
MFQEWLPWLSKHTKTVINCYHGKYGDSQEIDDNLDFIRENHQHLARIIVSFKEMKERLALMSIPKNKIHVIPIGINHKVFSIPTNESKNSTLEKYKLPKTRFLVGSFQKDGTGWQEGFDPKLIKGPDLLVETLEIVSSQMPIHVILTGPARGYVRKELMKRSIAFTHLQPESAEELARLYGVLDLYLITSREEGGPKGLIEALAVGCPVVTTPVGMATDIDSSLPFYSRISNFEPKQLAFGAMELLSKRPQEVDHQGLRSLTESFSFESIARRHLNDIYLDILT